MHLILKPFKNHVMNIPFSFGHPQADNGTISLRRVLARQLRWFQPLAVKKNSFVINDVPGDFRVSVNKELLVTAIYDLLESVISKTSHGCIRISVKRYRHTVLFRITDGTATYQRGFIQNWQRVKPVAEKMGGSVIVNSGNGRNVSVTLSFRCLSDAA
jgi:hypothetical protein